MKGKLRRRTPFALPIVVLALVCTLGGVSCSSASAARKGSAADDSPNVLFVVADDMRFDDLETVADLKPGGGFDWVRRHGTRFPKLHSTDNLCCPGRVTLLTGKTAYNHGVLTNAHLPDLQRGTLPVWLGRAGYCSGFSGKYLNSYEAASPRPAGWTYFEPLVKSYDDEYGYRVARRDGTTVRPGVFITDQLAATARRQLADCRERDQPAFIALFPFAPHFGSSPEPDYAAVDVPWSTSDPSFNEADLSDKPPWLQSLHPEPAPSAEISARRSAAVRVRTLLSVDDALRALLDDLQARDELRNTLVVLTSDNGYLLSEHRISNRKFYAYEAAQPALWIAGPGFPEGAEVPAFVTNLDVAPTIMDASGASAQFGSNPPGDGRTVQAVLAEPDLGGDRFLPIYIPTDVSASGERRAPAGNGVRTGRYKYVRYVDGGEELYDLVTDPFEERNVAADPGYGTVRQTLVKLQAAAKRCAGDTCRVSAPAALRG